MAVLKKNSTVKNSSDNFLKHLLKKHVTDSDFSVLYTLNEPPPLCDHPNIVYSTPYDFVRAYHEVLLLKLDDYN